MDTIVTPVTVITLDSTRIVHSIKADLVARYFPPVVRLVQYDQSLPVIAVSMMQNGQTYTLPSGAAANIRVHKPDATYVYNPALGCDSTRNIVYFEVTQAMAAASGDGLAIVEIVVNGDIAGTSLITLHFEENPVPEDAIESSDEWETIYELGERIIASTVTPVSTAAGMTDHNVVYLYTGTESGWNQGHMYYYNGTTWVDAGIAVTDTTLSVAGLAADAKATGDAIADLNDDIDKLFITDTASGSIASFPDGADNVPVKSLTVNVEPVQDLHGYDSPWPAGGGKNILRRVAETTKTSQGITYTLNDDIDQSVTVNGTATSDSYYAYSYNTTSDALDATPYIGESLTFAIDASVANIVYVYTTYFKSDGTFANLGSGGTFNTITFTVPNDAVGFRILLRVRSGSTAQNIKVRLMMRLSSDGDNSFAPYENVCPISGHTQAKLTRCGKNLLKFTKSPQTTNGITFTPNADGSFTVSGTASANAYFNIYTWTDVDGVGLPIQTPLAISGGTSDVRFIVSYRDSDGTGVVNGYDDGSGAKLTIPSHTKQMYIALRVLSGVTINTTVYPMIRPESDTDATYEPYNGQTVTISLNGTRYGGTLDVASGVLTVDHAQYVFNGSERITAQNVGWGTNVLDNTIKPSIDNNTISDILCDIFSPETPTHVWNHTSDNIIAIAKETDNYKIRFYSSAFVGKTASEVATEMSGHMIVYPLATPQTVQLTAQEVKTLLGQNNIWNDCGDTTVEYRADTALYIKKLTGSTEDDMVADANIVSGKYFMVGNTLYKATANIASGGAITPNVNCTRKSLPEALNEINA